MRYRIIEYTYVDLSLGYTVEFQKATNQAWKEDSKKYDKQKDAEDWILAKLAAVDASTVVTRVVLATVYE